MSVHKVRYLRYARLPCLAGRRAARQACSQNGHLRNVNSHFSNCASPCPPYFVLKKARLDCELSESDTEVYRLALNSCLSAHFHLFQSFHRTKMPYGNNPSFSSYKTYFHRSDINIPGLFRSLIKE